MSILSTPNPPSPPAPPLPATAPALPPPSTSSVPEVPPSRIEQVLKLAVVILLIAGCLFVIWPFLSSLLWAMVLCFTTWPLYARLLHMVGERRRTLAAAIMTIAFLLVLVAPFAIMGMSLADEVQRFTENVRQALAAGPPAPPGWFMKIPLVGGWLTEFWRDIATNNAQRMADLKKFIDPLRDVLLIVALSLGRGIIELLVSLLIAFFLYRDGVTAAESLKRAIERLGGEDGKALLDTAGNTVRSVVYGILGTALTQSVVAGIGFFIAGIPQAALLAFLTFFLSVLPIGPPLVWIPAAVWLLYKGWHGWAIFMVCWGVLVSSVDNVVKPLIIRFGGAELPFIVILMGVLGGAMAFGFIGVFLGPTLLAIGFQLLARWTPAVVAKPSAAAPKLIE